MKRRLLLILAIIVCVAMSSTSLAKDSIQFGDTKKDVLEVLGAPTRVSKFPIMDTETWSYGIFSSITFKGGSVYEYSGGEDLKIRLLPSRETDVEIDFLTIGSTCDDVISVLGTPDRVSKFPIMDTETWSYGILSSITFKGGRVYEYAGGQNLKIAINPNGEYLDFNETGESGTKYYSYGPERYSVEDEEDYYGVSVRLSENKSEDYYGTYYPRVAENESYYGQISEYTGRPKTVYVRGYFRKDGTYVRSHYRSRPRR